MKTSLLILACLALNVSAQTIQDYQNFIKPHEGYSLTVYLDTTGNKSVGIGHKILPSDNIAYKISPKTCESLFARDTAKALAIAKRVVPTFDKQPKNVKPVLCSMSFQMGESGVRKFKKMLEAASVGDYGLMSVEMLKSKWAREQTPERAKHHAQLVRNCGI